MQGQAGDIPHPFDEQRVLRELESFGTVRLQSKGAPDAADRTLTQRAALGRGVCRPVRGLARLRFQRQLSTGSTAVSLIFRGALGRCSSSSPSRRWARKCLRHLPTVCMITDSRPATAVLRSPSAQANTTRHHSAKACAELCRDTSPLQNLVSSEVSSKNGMGRPTGIGILLSKIYYSYL